jgi:hypothetical protein
VVDRDGLLLEGHSSIRVRYRHQGSECLELMPSARESLPLASESIKYNFGTHRSSKSRLYFYSIYPAYLKPHRLASLIVSERHQGIRGIDRQKHKRRYNLITLCEYWLAIKQLHFFSLTLEEKSSAIQYKCRRRLYEGKQVKAYTPYPNTSLGLLTVI